MSILTPNASRASAHAAKSSDGKRRTRKKNRARSQARELRRKRRLAYIAALAGRSIAAEIRRILGQASTLKRINRLRKWRGLPLIDADELEVIDAGGKP